MLAFSNTPTKPSFQLCCFALLFSVAKASSSSQTMESYGLRASSSSSSAMEVTPTAILFEDAVIGRRLQDGECLCDEPQQESVTTVRMLAPGGLDDPIGNRFRNRAAAYFEKTGVNVEVIGVGGNLGDLNSEIMADTSARVYDGYVFLPFITGEVMEKDGLADLSDIVVSNPDLVWTDIFPFNRDLQAVYDDDVRTIPCDGDVYSMFYRKDLFEQYNQKVPRTWDEYTEVAKFFDGMEVADPNNSSETITMTGSCVERASSCNWQYHLNVLVHAATTQAQGTSSSPFFDPETFEPLLGEGFAETLRHLEGQSMFGDERELGQDCVDLNTNAMLQGQCAITYYWGNVFVGHLNEELSVLQPGMLGVAPTPGVTKVLDRDSGKLVQCDEKTCPHGTDYPDIGRVNYAPFAAAGGWSAGVAGGVSAPKQKAMADFMSFVCGKDESIEDVIPFAKGGIVTGADPYRKSHFNVEKWVERGFEEDTSTEYLATIQDQLSSPNTVLDGRFNGAYGLLAGMYDIIYEHLAEAKNRTMTHEDRMAAATRLEASWLEQNAEYDLNRPAGSLPIKALYQKSVNMYNPPKENQGMSVGTIVGIVVGCSLFVGLFVGGIILVYSLRRIEEEKKLAEERAKQRLLDEQDCDDDDDDSTEFGNESSLTKRDETKEIMNFAKKENRKVVIIRWVFILAFLAAGISCAMVTRRLVEEGQPDNFNLSSTTAALVIASLFVFVGGLFFLYERSVQQRNAKIMENAARANAVVTSLFPGQFRDQVIEDKDQDSTKKEKLGTKSKMKGYLVDGNYDEAQDEEKPLADLFLDTSVLFADVAGFTAWSSVRDPSQVFTLLESVFGRFDEMAKKRRVFKVETVGDCYVAATGIPEPRKDHARDLARFAKDIMNNFPSIVRELEVKLGPSSELGLRIGIHSGPVTAGVLRGDRARFQLFGDTMNVASRIEGSGRAGRIHVSAKFAAIMKETGREHWLESREESIDAKGIGSMQTYWLNVKSGGARSVAADIANPLGAMDSETQRLIEWNTETLLGLMKRIVARRSKKANAVVTDWAKGETILSEGETYLDEVAEIIELPKHRSTSAGQEVDPNKVEIDPMVIDQLRDYVTEVSAMYNDNPFHNFEHASHVSMSVIKLLNRITAPSDIDDYSLLHDHTYGITSDPMIQFACGFSALIHDADHQGIPNTQLVEEKFPIAAIYKNRSVAEQNSLHLAWGLLLQENYMELRNTICATKKEFKHFRQLVVNSVMATDIVDKDMKTLRNNRWDKAFKLCDAVENERDSVNRKATIVIEHLIQASDISHTMQHWNIYRKWNERLFEELYKAYKQGRSKSSPEAFWAKGEIGFFDFYIIPLAKKLKECGVFGVSSGEFLSYAEANREQWLSKGESITAEMIEKFSKKDYNAPPPPPKETAPPLETAPPIPKNGAFDDQAWA